MDKKSDQCEDNHEVNLGSLLQSMDYEIRERGDSFTGEEEKFLEFLEMVAILRRHHDVDPVRHRIKMLQDKNRFVELLKQRTGKIKAFYISPNDYSVSIGLDWGGGGSEQAIFQGFFTGRKSRKGRFK